MLFRTFHCARYIFQNPIIINKFAYFNRFYNLKLASMSTQIPTHTIKDSGNRKFYSIPEDYYDLKSVESPDICKRELLLREIYSNIYSNSASFEGPFGRRQVLYCDYAASGQPVRFIEDFIAKEVLPFYSNTHTTNTATSLQSTYFRHEARDLIRKAVNASEHDAVIFTGNGCTSAVSKLITALNLKVPTIIFVGPYEHHSNLLPWKEIGDVVRINETKNGLVDLNCLETELKTYYGKGYQLIGAFSAASNVTGIMSDDNAISILLHKYKALAFWDYAAAGPYVKINMNPVVLGNDEGLAYKDAMFLSIHKFVGGVDSPGILIAKKRLFENPIPSEPGGGTIFFVSRDSHRYLKNVEMREEGGTPSIVGAIRAGMAIQLKEAVGHVLISKRENEICRKVLENWSRNENLIVLGNITVPRLPIFSFVILDKNSGMYLHHNFICTLLNDLFGIQSRSGCACAGPYALDVLGIDESLAQVFDSLLVENSALDRTHLRRQEEFSDREIVRPGFVRVCFPYFMSDDHINFVIDAVLLVAQNGWKLLPQYLFNPETGEWKHKSKLIFTDRKWLGSISYKEGRFNFVKKGGSTELSCPVGKDLLNEAKTIFDMSVQVAAKMFVPDQDLIFDDESSALRWFLLPSEAKQYLLGERRGSIKEKVFKVKGLPTKKDLIKWTEPLKHSRILFCDSKRDTLDENIHECNGHVESYKPILAFTCHETESRVHDDNFMNLPFDNKANEKCNLLKNQTVFKIESSQDNILKCKWHSPPGSIFRPFLKAVAKFNMIKDGDKVLACISGGKDSLSMLHTLRQYKFYANKKGIRFQLGAMTVDPKSPSYDPSPLKSYLSALGVPYFYEEQGILTQAVEMEKCTSICSFCSRLKRGRIYACARREGYNVIALGQHLDDLAESFMMSVFHNGRLRTMKASYIDKSSSLQIIRPFVFVREKDLRKFAEQKKLPVIPENCPACFEAPKERHRIKQLLAAQEVQFPNLYHSLKCAMYPIMAINATGVEDKLLGKNANLTTDFYISDSDDA